MAAKPKILIMIPDRLIQATGGMGENLYPLLKILSSSFDFYVVGFPATPDQIPSFIKGYSAPSDPFAKVAFPPIAGLGMQLEYFAAALAFPKPDLVLAYDWSIYPASVKLAKYHKIPLIVEMCLSPIMLGRDGFYYGLDLDLPASRAIHHTFCEMEKQGLFEADRIIQISDGYARRFSEVPEFQVKTRIVPMCMDTTNWLRQKRDTYILPGKAPNKIIFIGRFVKNKGILQLCRAEVPDKIDLIFIGAKESAEKVCLDAILDCCKSNQNVHYIGPLYGQEKIRALTSVQGLIVPSLHEPFGIVGLEGLASGNVVLSSRVDGLGDFLNDDTSLECGTTVQSIERSYARFLSLETAGRGRLISNGLDKCKLYDAQIVAKQLQNVFEECL